MMPETALEIKIRIHLWLLWWAWNFVTYITQADADIIESSLIAKGEFEQKIRIDFILLHPRVKEPPNLVRNKPASAGENELK